jgi:hypothetical protein
MRRQVDLYLHVRAVAKSATADRDTFGQYLETCVLPLLWRELGESEQHYVSRPANGAPPVEVPVPTFPGCHLELRLLSATDTCGSCGHVARDHKAWYGHRA